MDAQQIMALIVNIAISIELNTIWLSLAIKRSNDETISQVMEEFHEKKHEK